MKSRRRSRHELITSSLSLLCYLPPDTLPRSTRRETEVGSERVKEDAVDARDIRFIADEKTACLNPWS